MNDFEIAVNSLRAAKRCCVKSAGRPAEATPCPISAGDKQEDVNPMKYQQTDTTAVAVVQSAESDLSKARERLTRRISEVSSDKRSELRKTFFIDAPDAPKTFNEAMERIQAGQFQKWDDAKQVKDGTMGYDWYDMLNWRVQPEDEVGYGKAKRALDTVKEDALDIILTQDEKAGLDALNAFKTWTFSA